jgi:anti-sigma B factor antagonist
MHRIKVESGHLGVILRLAGDLDVKSVGELRDVGLGAIKQADGRAVVIDVAGLTFIDSTGLGALVTLNNAARDTGTPLTLRSVPPRMATLMRLTALDQVFATDEVAKETDG